MKCTCPNCGHEYNAVMTADMEREHALSFRIIPSDGAMLSPLHVGGMMRSFERLLVAIGNDADMATFVGLRGLSMDEVGAVTITATIMRRATPPAPGTTEGGSDA